MPALHFQPFLAEFRSSFGYFCECLEDCLEGRLLIVVRIEQ
jgi:hypothetical protein